MGNRFNFGVVGLLSFLILLLISALLFVQSQRGLVDQPIDALFVKGLTQDFQNKHSLIGSAVFPLDWSQKRPVSLYKPEFMFPDDGAMEDRSLRQIVRTLDKCNWSHKESDIKILTGNTLKYAQFYEHVCKKKELPDSLWKSPPLNHPLGGSWAHWIFSKGLKNLDWLTQNKQSLHVLEQNELLNEASDLTEKVLAEMSPAEFNKTLFQKEIVTTPQYVLFYNHHEIAEFTYHTYPIKEWNDYLNEQNIQVSAFVSESCVVVNDNLCWSHLKKSVVPLSEDQIIKLLLILVFFLILSFLFYLWKNYTNETKLRSQHQLVMQTLAHELRHPVTGFRLSIEAIRPHYDELPDKLSAEFLRLADTSKKMTRIVSFTRSYLHLLLKDGQFQFKNDSVESFQNFLSQVLEDYEDKIELQTPEYDLSCSLDTYWLSTCIKNLVVNALTYGEKPIVVTWSLVDDDLAIVVRDSGQGLDKTLKELVKPHIRKSESGGLGLGLSLVYRLVELMGGELQLKTKPTKFTIVLKGVDGEKTFNR